MTNTTAKRPQPYAHFKLTKADDALIALMSDAHQGVLRLNGSSYEEIAKQLGIAAGTAKSRLHRARAYLVRLRNGESVRVVNRA